MRVRKKKHGSERLAAAGDLLCTDKTVTLADPIAPFGIARSALHLEIGCGKGKFSVPPHTFDCIYLNFSDPWPKAGHYKRRLTYRAFLELYKSLLKEGGVLRLKTDNAGLFDFSLGEFEAAGMDVVKCSRDLHASPFAEGNVMTEYETNFTAKGMPIYFAEVRVK